MLCYKDRTYCASKKHNKRCPGVPTKEDREQAKKIGLPFAWAYYCGEPKK